MGESESEVPQPRKKIKKEDTDESDSDDARKVHRERDLPSSYRKDRGSSPPDSYRRQGGRDHDARSPPRREERNRYDRSPASKKGSRRHRRDSIDIDSVD